jgi:protein-L-isoaspartate(D-aspartate) O-methyltransferase
MMMTQESFDSSRIRMVNQQLIARGIEKQRVIDAFLRVKRERFVTKENQKFAYEDTPLPIGDNQTISQPYMVALMTELLDLDKTKTVLEIGTGSGYQTAILATLAKTVHTVERIDFLLQKAKIVLNEEGFENIDFHLGDGWLGWKDKGPYDAIIVTAAADEIPQDLLGQLDDGGRLVIPVGGKYVQTLWLIKRIQADFQEQAICGCRFVPLVKNGGIKK